MKQGSKLSENNISKRLLLPDYEQFQRKMNNPSSRMAGLIERFRRRMAQDEKFRAENIFILAALGERKAVEEARLLILGKARDYGNIDGNLDHVNNHTWCVAPGVMRLAAYYTWIEALGIWTPEESTAIAEGLIHFCTEHVVSVMRARAPGGHNQALSMALTCAVVGSAFEKHSPVEHEAQALKDYGLQGVIVTLGLMDRDGYTGEGSTYQSHVIAPLIMWTTAFLAQIHGPEILNRRWEPSGVSLLDLLKVESLMASPGLLLPPWDHYGWQEQLNLAAIAYWSSLTGQSEALAHASAIWDRQNFIAWGSDDRMWTLIYWPTLLLPTDNSSLPTGSISGWTLPSTGTAIDHGPSRSRVMMVWDRCAGDLQGIGRAQMNPNHLMYEVAGVPIFGDGVSVPGVMIVPQTIAEIAAPLSKEERRLIAMQYGSLEKWAQGVQPGFLGAANVIVPDDADAYFQRHCCVGQLCQETRTPNCHCVTAEAVDFYQPRFDLTRARRTISVKPSGLVWVADDCRAQTAHQFRWQLYLRRQASLDGNSLQINTPEGVCVSMAWLPGSIASIHDMKSFPEKKMAWPDDGSQRLELRCSGETADFVVCWLPERVEGLEIHKLGEGVWRAEWDGGSDTFRIPEGVDNPVKRVPELPISFNDLDTEPFSLLNDSTENLLLYLKDPALENWRRTTAAMQTLTIRGIESCLPLIQRFLTDPAQRYQVHSVAAWCLGRVAYRPALDDLRLMAKAPEINTALRAQWATERIIAG